MGRIYVAAAIIVFLVLVGAGVFIYYNRTTIREENRRAGRPMKGDLTAKQEQVLVNMLNEAAWTMEKLLDSVEGRMGLDETSFLTSRQQVNIVAWLKIYHDNLEKVIK